MVFMRNLFSPLIISILASLALGYPAMYLAKRLQIIDMPASAPHKTHAYPTPHTHNPSLSSMAEP